MRMPLFLSTALLSAIIISGCASSRLHNAIVINDNNKVVELVQSDKSILSKEDDKGQTPLVLASIYTREEMIRYMLEAGADPNLAETKGGTPLTEAAYKGYLPIVELLLKHGAKADLPGVNGWTPLHFAVKQNFYPVAKLLINRGADVNKQNDNGSTPLHIASSNGGTAIARLLLTHGANPNLQDKKGATPLMIAASGGFKPIAEDLLRKGADTQLLSSDKKKAKDLAEEAGFADIAQLIESPQAPDITIGDDGNLPKVVLGKVDSKFDGNETPPSSLRALELRSSIGHFLDMLCESGKFGQVDTLDEANEKNNAFFLSLKILETENRHVGANVTKAFFSGLLTFGLIPPSADYGYKSEMTLVVVRPGGKKKEYKASSDTAASWRGDPRTSAYLKRSRNAGEAARKLASHQAFESLISQLETDSFIREE
jgi:ankyrin repeat protein